MMKEYGTLIEKFLKEELSTEEFADKYIKSWLSEPGSIPEPLYRVLEDVFESAECYSPRATPENETGLFISGKTLRQDVVAESKRLETLRRHDPDA